MDACHSTVLVPHLTGELHRTAKTGGQSSVYSRLRPDLSKVVEELRQVGLEQPLKLQAQRHYTLREHTCTS